MLKDSTIEIINRLPISESERTKLMDAIKADLEDAHQSGYSAGDRVGYDEGYEAAASYYEAGPAAW